MTQPHEAAPHCPLVLCTDAGTDPDDAVAVLLALEHPDLDTRLIVSAAEEPGYLRFRFLRRLLGAVDHHRRRVSGAAAQPVPRLFAGRALALRKPAQDRARGHFCCSPLLDVGPGAPPVRGTEDFDAFCSSLHRLVGASGPGGVTYASVGGCSNLAAYLSRHPGDAPRLRVVAMLGNLHPEAPLGRAEYNVRLDLAAARRVMAFRAAGLRVELVPVDATTSDAGLEVRPGGSAAPPSPVWALARAAGGAEFETLLRGNLELFVERMRQASRHRFPGSFMHDPLALAVAAGRFRAAPARVVVDHRGHMRHAQKGLQTGVLAPGTFDAAAFWTWAGQAAARTSRRRLACRGRPAPPATTS